MESGRRKIGIVLAFVVLFATLAFVCVGCASGTTPPEEEWNKTFGGGVLGDCAYSVQQTAGGGYIVAGEAWSYPADFVDAWLGKIDSDGNAQWGWLISYAPHEVGRSEFDCAYSVQQTTDGGYIFAGSTHKLGLVANSGFYFWLVKTDPYGDIQWQKAFGPTGFEGGRSVQQTKDGGYVLAGYKEAGAWLVKTDPNGNKQWDRTDKGVRAYSVQQTTDGGYILAGSTNSYGAGSFDAWLVKTDSDGNELYNKTFGGVKNEGAESVQQTEDGGYILAGYTHTYTKSTGSAIWLIKVKGEPTETPVSPPTSTATPTVPTTTPTPTPKILFSDDFSDDGSGWVTYDEYDGRVIYEDGCLYVTDYTNPEFAMYGESQRYFTDFIIEVETRLVGGTDDNWHLVGCRFKDEGNTYWFGISADGYYTINKEVNGKVEVLVAPTRSVYIHQGRDVTNLIHVECIGSSLSLSVNGHLLRKVTDATFTGGDIALGANSLAGTFTEVTFDNLVVTEP